MANNILVFVERRDGEIKRPSLQAIGKARSLAETLGGSVDALVLGPGAASADQELASRGADRVFAAEDAHLELYASEAYAATLAAVARENGAGVILVAATSMGKDLAPRTAAKLEAGLLSDVVDLQVTADGALQARRPVYSGKAFATVTARAGGIAMATLRPNAFPLPDEDGGRTAEVVNVAAGMSEDQLRVRTVRVEKSAQQELDVSEASIIVSGGRGLKEPENFKVVKELADALGAAVGASRAAVDAGWIEHSHQVGQTGKVVSPDLYIACGISGAIQHLAGMSSAKVIVAINKDEEAPIFKVADYGIVGDLFEVVPKIAEEVRKVKSEG